MRCCHRVLSSRHLASHVLAQQQPRCPAATLVAAAAVGDPAARRSALGSAQQQYMAYLHRARQYGVLGAECTAMLGALEEGDSQGEGRGAEGATGAAGGRQGLDPTTLREHKIAKFKR